MAKYLTKETLKYMDYGAYIGNKSGPAGGKTMTDLRKAIQAVKEGSLSTMRIMGRPQQRMTPSERMARYHVPGFRFAPIHHDEIAWAGG